LTESLVQGHVELIDTSRSEPERGEKYMSIVGFNGARTFLIIEKAVLAVLGSEDEIVVDKGKSSTRTLVDRFI
jgi:hypothetical protein